MAASQDRPRKGRAEQRQSLVAQARLLFATQGYAPTTTEQVAAAAGVRPSVANRLFPTRSDLFRDLLEELQTATLRAWRDQTADVADPYARLQALAERYLEGARTHALAIRAVSRVLVECDEEEVRAGLRSFALEWEDFLAGLIAQGQQSGFFRRSLDPRVGAWQLIHAALASVLTRPLCVPLLEQSGYTAQAIECAFHCLLKTDV